MLCTGCGTQSTDSGLMCGGCSNTQRRSGDKNARPGSTPAIFKVGQAIQQQAIPDRRKRWKRAQRLWSQCAIACAAILIIFVIGSQ